MKRVNFFIVLVLFVLILVVIVSMVSRPGGDLAPDLESVEGGLPASCKCDLTGIPDPPGCGGFWPIVVETRGLTNFDNCNLNGNKAVCEARRTPNYDCSKARSCKNQLTGNEWVLISSAQCEWK
jgi:hypothetical protein